MSPSSSLFLLFLGHAAHPPLHPTIRSFNSLALLASRVGMQRSSGAGTRCKLIFWRSIVVVKVDIVTLEVLVLRRKLRGIEVVVDVRVGLFG
jgi:hypothetical protein